MFKYFLDQHNKSNWKNCNRFHPKLNQRRKQTYKPYYNRQHGCWLFHINIETLVLFNIFLLLMFCLQFTTFMSWLDMKQLFGTFLIFMLTYVHAVFSWLFFLFFCLCNLSSRMLIDVVLLTIVTLFHFYFKLHCT